MSKFMKTVESYEMAFDESIIEEQDRELKALMFESLVLTESVEIASPVLEGEIIDRIKDIASNIWNKIVGFFNTIANTIGGWITELRNLFNKKKNAQNNSNTQSSNANGEEQNKPNNQASDIKKEEEQAKPSENGTTNKVTIDFSDCLNPISTKYNVTELVNGILEKIQKVYNSSESLYKSLDDNAVNNLSETVNKDIDTINKEINDALSSKEVVEISSLETADKYIKGLETLRNMLINAGKKSKSLSNNSASLCVNSVKKGPDAEKIAGKIHNHVMRFCNALFKTLKPLRSSSIRIKKQLVKYLNS